jgi:hypothetical protein
MTRSMRPPFAACTPLAPVSTEMASKPSEDEVTKAYAEERKRGQTVLFPIRIDNNAMTTEKAWAGKLRDGRHIGDFREWKDHDAYKQSLARVLRDLTIKPLVS